MLNNVGRKNETKNFATLKSHFQLDGNEISMLRSMMTHRGISHLRLLCSRTPGGRMVNSFGIYPLWLVGYSITWCKHLLRRTHLGSCQCFEMEATVRIMRVSTDKNGENDQNKWAKSARVNSRGLMECYRRSLCIEEFFFIIARKNSHNAYVFFFNFEAQR